VASNALKSWAAAYAGGDIDSFNAQTPKIVESLRALAPQFYPSATSLQFEHQYMVSNPFFGLVIYFIALIVLLFTALWMKQTGYIATWALVLVGLGFEIYGFACRIIISAGRQ